MTLTSPENMMKVRAVSPLELSEAWIAWSEATSAVKRGEEPHPLLARTGRADATDEEIAANDLKGYSRRAMAGLFEWLKEV